MLKKAVVEDENELAIVNCLSEHYGIEGAISRLPGENLNYLVKSREGNRFVFKIVDEDMPAAIVAMEYEAIEYSMSHGLSYRLPQILKNRRDTVETGIRLRNNALNRARLITFIDGIQLDECTDISQKLANNVGCALAKFDLLMSGFEHPAAVRNHRWNLADAGQHLTKIDLFDEPGQRKLLGWAFDKWADEAHPKLSSLPHQFIHGDAHGENILISGDEVSGLIDFGDCCVNPTICELAICLTYLMMGHDHPLVIGKNIISGYHALRPISEQEFTVLMPLICGRLATTICVAEERRRIDPEHPNWFDSVPDAWRFMQFLFENRFEHANMLLL